MSSSLSPFAPENLVSRDGFGIPIPLQPAHLHTQADSGAYLITGFLPSSAAASMYYRYILCTMNAAVHIIYVNTMYHDISSTAIMLRQFD